MLGVETIDFLGDVVLQTGEGGMARGGGVFTGEASIDAGATGRQHNPHERCLGIDLGAVCASASLFVGRTTGREVCRARGRGGGGNVNAAQTIR